ncbi:unnamed protein product [Urochloa humidicola]
MAGAAASQAVRAGWASFDRCVILGHHQGDDVVPSESTTTAAAVSRTINGREVRVSLRLAAPPAASYVLLDTDDCAYGTEPEVVAADGNLLLIHMFVQTDGPLSRWQDPEHNFFVYKAHLERPWLACLPSLGSWRGVARYTGIVRCAGGEHFVVADLQPRAVVPGGEVAELFRYSSATGRWELMRLSMPAGVGPTLCFETDAVFALGGGGRMCWADYHRGVLVLDADAAAGGDDPALRFVRFPLAKFWDGFPDGRGLPAKYRAACVSRGRLWFVDVDDGRFRRAPTRRSSDDGTVTAWTLRTLEMEWWTKEHTLRFGELWSGWKYRRSPLPRSMPGFPMVDRRRADVIHFIVEAPEGPWDSEEPYWTITVDMRNRCLMSYELYQNAIEVPEADMDVSNVFFNESFVCCDLRD